MKPGLRFLLLGGLIFAFTAALSINSYSQCNTTCGIIVNEASNGTGGLAEYFEFLVVGDPDSCAIDLRGWIFDDNNGDFACGPRTSVGIAFGHGRFASVSPWDSVPLGSIILIYNNADKNSLITAADDPTDSNNDLIYILPHDHASLEITDDTPVGTTGSCPGTGSTAYSPATYNVTSWNPLGLRNTGDAIQTRSPDGTYFHGISYGGGSSGITGGPDGLLVHASAGSGDAFIFASGDYRSVANYSQVTAGSGTPGAPNSAVNTSFISTLQGGSCPLPVKYEVPLHAVLAGQAVQLKWSTASEINAHYFELQRATSLTAPFETVERIQAGGNADDLREYSYFDQEALGNEIWYRLRQVDFDGQVDYSDVLHVRRDMGLQLDDLEVYPQPAEDLVNFRFVAETTVTIRVYDLRGKELRSVTLENPNGQVQLPINTAGMDAGIYLYKISGGGISQTGKLWVK